MKRFVSTLLQTPRQFSKTTVCNSTRLRMSTADSAPAPAPWYAAYPAPKSEVVTISRDVVLEMLKSTPVEKRDFILVDLRRNDFEVCFRALMG